MNLDEIRRMQARSEKVATGATFIIVGLVALAGLAFGWRAALGAFAAILVVSGVAAIQEAQSGR